MYHFIGSEKLIDLPKVIQLPLWWISVREWKEQWPGLRRFEIKSCLAIYYLVFKKSLICFRHSFSHWYSFMYIHSSTLWRRFKANHHNTVQLFEWFWTTVFHVFLYLAQLFHWVRCIRLLIIHIPLNWKCKTFFRL